MRRLRVDIITDFVVVKRKIAQADPPKTGLSLTSTELFFEICWDVKAGFSGKIKMSGNTEFSDLWGPSYD